VTRVQQAIGKLAKRRGYPLGSGVRRLLNFVYLTHLREPPLTHLRQPCLTHLRPPFLTHLREPCLTHLRCCVGTIAMRPWKGRRIRSKVFGLKIRLVYDYRRHVPILLHPTLESD
jgi:hypothetical protein